MAILCLGILPLNAGATLQSQAQPKVLRSQKNISPQPATRASLPRLPKVGDSVVSRSVMPPAECKAFRAKLADRVAAKGKNACDVISTTTITATRPATSPAASPASLAAGCDGTGYRIHQQRTTFANAWSVSQDDWIDFWGTPSPCTNRYVSAHDTQSVDEHYCRVDYAVLFVVEMTECYTSGNGSVSATAGMRFNVTVITNGVPGSVLHGGDINATNANFVNEWSTSIL